MTRRRSAPPPDPPEPTAATTYRPTHPLDIGFAVMGTKTVKRRAGVYWWVTTTPEGPATVAFRPVAGVVRADAWGPGTDWALTQLPALLGRDDDLAGFHPHHPVVADLLDRFGSLRIGATGRWYEALVTGAIGQRVVTADAGASRSALNRRHGAPPPGVPPFGLVPDPEAMLRIDDGAFHRVGIERTRARVLRIAAKYADRLERLDDVPAADATAWLQRLPGIGPWTAAFTTAAAGGDADAVPVGDLHIPRVVSYALGGDDDGDDARMLELLEPYVGHRQRVVRMVKMGGAGPAEHRPHPFRYDISRI